MMIGISGPLGLVVGSVWSRIVPINAMFLTSGILLIVLIFFVVRDKAIVFAKGNVNELKNKLQDLLDKPERVNKFKQESVEYICENYDWEEVVKKTLDLYFES